MKRLLGVVMLATLVAAAEAQNWRLDPEASRLGFTATWEGSPFETEFRRFEADIQFDPQAPEEGRIEVRVDVTSVDSASPDRDEGMGDPAWFDFARHPEARYQTTAIRAAADGDYVADGRLTLKGTTVPVEVQLRWETAGDSARLQARAQVLRTAFSIGEGEWAESDDIGFEVQIFGDLLLRPADD